MRTVRRHPMGWGLIFAGSALVWLWLAVLHESWWFVPPILYLVVMSMACWLYAVGTGADGSR